jgi:hypothetical protein
VEEAEIASILTVAKWHWNGIKLGINEFVFTVFASVCVKRYNIYFRHEIHDENLSHNLRRYKLLVIFFCAI